MDRQTGGLPHLHPVLHHKLDDALRPRQAETARQLQRRAGGIVDEQQSASRVGINVAWSCRRHETQLCFTVYSRHLGSPWFRVLINGNPQTLAPNALAVTANLQLAISHRQQASQSCRAVHSPLE
jgi:hypothetical protein